MAVKANLTEVILDAVYPKQALRLIKDPVKGIFVPLIVSTLPPQIVIAYLNFFTGTFICHHLDRYD